MAVRHMSWDYIGATLSWALVDTGVNLADDGQPDAVALLAGGSFTVAETDPIGRARSLRKQLFDVDAQIGPFLDGTAMCLLIAYKSHGFGAKTPPPVWPHLLAFHYSTTDLGDFMIAVNPNIRSRLAFGPDFASVLAGETAAAGARAVKRGTVPAKGSAAVARKKHIAANVVAAGARYHMTVECGFGPATYGAIAQALAFESPP